MFGFGLIRGVAVFNHSPFMSMHMWLIAVVMLPEVVAPLWTASLLATGLALWTIVNAGVSVVRPHNADTLLTIATSGSLRRTDRVARLDGAGLVLLGIALLIA